MAPKLPPYALASLRFPRLRGDGPATVLAAITNTEVSPPARGWPRHTNQAALVEAGFPACAGMAPTTWRRKSGGPRFPRLRGDGPLEMGIGLRSDRVSPPARGWPLHAHRRGHVLQGFPACAGMAPGRGVPRTCVHQGFPACAGMDPPPRTTTWPRKWSPRLRGDGP